MLQTLLFSVLGASVGFGVGPYFPNTATLVPSCIPSGMFDYTSCTDYANAVANQQCICNAFAANITAVIPLFLLFPPSFLSFSHPSPSFSFHRFLRKKLIQVS